MRYFSLFFLVSMLTACPNENANPEIICGDGALSGSEICDDGNDINGDGCDNNCTITGCDNGVASSGERCFDAGATLITAGTFPVDVEAADLNGDDKLDIVVANEGSDNISVLLQGDNKSFSATLIAVGTQPSAIVVGDIDNDGNLDILSANSGSDNVSILLNDGAGAFLPSTNLIAGDNPSDIQLADLNEDGALDIVVSNATGQQTTVFFSNGNTFDSITLTAQVEPEAVAIADYDGDEKLDIGIACASGEVASIFLNQGNRSFSAPQDFGISFTAVSMVAGDVDNDQDQDLVVVNFDGAGANLIRNDGTGAFGDIETTAIVGDSPTSLVLADMDGDNALDVVMTTTSAAVILANPGNGNFVAQTDLASGDFIQGVTVADIDNDGGLDIITANGGSNDIGILFSNF
jgi:cysteine-rich repeat protein